MEEEVGRKSFSVGIHSRFFPQGCVQSMGAELRKNILVVAAAALGIAFVEVRNAVVWGLSQCRASREPGQSGPWMGLGKLALPPPHPHLHLSF